MDATLALLLLRSTGTLESKLPEPSASWSDNALVSSWADATELTVDRRLLLPASAPSLTLEARRPDDCDARTDKSSAVMRRVLQFGCGG